MPLLRNCQGLTHTLWCWRCACEQQMPERGGQAGTWGVRESEPVQRSQMLLWMSCELRGCWSKRGSPLPSSPMLWNPEGFCKLSNRKPMPCNLSCVETSESEVQILFELDGLVWTPRARNAVRLILGGTASVGYVASFFPCLM